MNREAVLKHTTSFKQNLLRVLADPNEAQAYLEIALVAYEADSNTDALAEASIMLKPLRKKNSKRQYKPWEVYLHPHRRKRVEVTNSLITQRIPRSIHAISAAGFEMKVVLFLIATVITLIIR
jgi:hypothetical protein